MRIAVANEAIRIPSELFAVKLRACAAGYEHRDLIQLYHGTRIACALLVEAEVKRAHILHRNCDMQNEFTERVAHTFDGFFLW